MSLGYAGRARLELEDTEIAIYSYTGEDWNTEDEVARKALESAIGQFAIDKSRLIEPEVHCRIRKKPNGRKELVEKKIVKRPDFSEPIGDGDIVIDKLCGVDAEAPDHRPHLHAPAAPHLRELPAKRAAPRRGRIHTLTANSQLIG